MKNTRKMNIALLWAMLIPLVTFAPVTHAVAQTCVQPPAGLISWWPGDGNATDIIDGNDGTLENGATFAPGQVGQAFSFDGMNDFVVSTQNSILTGNPTFTIDAWIFVPSGARITGRYPPILWWGQGVITTPGSSVFFSLHNTSRNKLFVGFFNGGQRMVGTFTNDEWHHVAWVRNGGGAANQGSTLYVDGVSVPLEDDPILSFNSVIPSVTASPYFIQFDAVGQFFEGLIDEVEVYDRALTASEIQAIFNAGSAGKCKPLTGFLCYEVKIAEGERKLEKRDVLVSNAFEDEVGGRVFILKKPRLLCVPSAVEDLGVVGDDDEDDDDDD